MSYVDVPVFASTTLSEFYSGRAVHKDCDLNTWDVNAIIDFS